MTPFAKPGRARLPRDGAEAARARARGRQGSTTRDVAAGLRRLRLRRLDVRPARVYELGLTGIPVFNVNNNCSTGSSALVLATPGGRRRVRPNACSRSASSRWAGRARREYRDDRPNPLERSEAIAASKMQGVNAAPPMAAQMFGGAGVEYLERYGTKRETFAQDVGEGAQARGRESVRGVPRAAHARGGHGLADDLRSADALPVLPAHVRRGRRGRLHRRVRKSARASTTAVVHRAQSMIDRLPRRLRRRRHDEDGRLRHGGQGRRRRSTSRPASGPKDVQVVELHDCFTTNELLTYEALGLTPEGDAEKFIRDGDNTYGGKCRDEPVGRPALEGPPARRDRPRAVHRARLAAARAGRRPPGRGRQARAAAQPRPRRRLRRHDVREGLA